MDRPLLVQVIPSLGGGGAEREVARVSRVLNQRSPFRIVVCCLSGRGCFADPLANAGVEIVVLNEAPRSPALLAMDLVRFLRARRPAVVHTHLLRWGAIAGRISGAPVVFASEHCWIPERQGVGLLCDRANARFADRILGVAEAVTEQRVDHWRIPMWKTATVLNAIETPVLLDQAERSRVRRELGVSDDSILLLNVGRLVEQKAQAFFVQAAATILQRCPQCRFLILGEGPLRGELEQQILDLNIADRVLLLGFRTDARDIMQAADISCLSSIYEGTPITTLEAMACGKPSIVTDVGGCSEVVDGGVTGLVVPPANVEALARAMLMLVENRTMRETMGKEGRCRVMSRYSEDANLNRLMDLYSSVMAEKGITLGSGP